MAYSIIHEHKTNPSDSGQEFEYVLSANEDNTVTGTITQKNDSTTSGWCGVLAVALLDNEKKPFVTFAIPSQCLDSKFTGKARTRSQTVHWKTEGINRIQGWDIQVIETGKDFTWSDVRNRVKEILGMFPSDNE